MAMHTAHQSHSYTIFILVHVSTVGLAERFLKFCVLMKCVTLFFAKASNNGQIQLISPMPYINLFNSISASYIGDINSRYLGDVKSMHIISADTISRPCSQKGLPCDKSPALEHMCIEN